MSQSSSISNHILLLVAAITVTIVTAAHDGTTPWSIRNKNIQTYIQHWMKDPDGTAREHGHIKHWDLSNVTSLRNLFAFNEDFNEDISSWNVSGVTDFSSLFWEANSFDQNLGAWDVSRAETMKCMFCGASSFKGDGLEAWNDSLHNVKDMFNMFEGSGITGDSLKNWNVSNVMTMREMFHQTPHFKAKLCWQVNPIATVTDMFNDTEACFDNSDGCVLPHISELAGCSSAPTTTARGMGLIVAALAAGLTMMMAL